MPAAAPLEPAADRTRPALTQAVTLLLAAACGLTVANIYYNQPLLGLFIRDFGGAAVVGFVPTATQIGYALGIMTLVPLGDRVDRRTVIVAQTLVLALALLIAALAPSAGVLLLASLLLGVAATVPQQIIPLAADLAEPKHRGSVIGMVMSGLICGVLLARTVSGLLGAAYGWRAVFMLAIVFALTTAGTLAAVLPSRPPANRLPYGQLLASTLALWREEPRLRVASLTQTCLFASFSVFWTVLALHLEQPPYHLGADVAGLFGLVGAGGALIAPLAGRLSDRYGPRLTIGLGGGATLLCWIMLGASSSLAVLAVGCFLLDAGMQGAMIGNQHVIFALRPEARNRLNTVYMGSVFSGGALGSTAAMLAWRAGGWTPVCGLGAILAVLALVIHQVMRPREAVTSP